MSKLLAAQGANYAYEIAARHAQQFGLSVDKVRPHVLLVALPLMAGQNAYEFNLKQGVNPHLPEIAELLGTNDQFIFEELGIGVMPVLCKRPVEGAEAILYPSNSRIFSYPDANVFSGAVGGAGVSTEAQSLQACFNGKLRIQVNSEVVIENYSTANFLYIPETQSSATTVPNLPGIVTRKWGKAYKMAGDKTNLIEIKLSGDVSNVTGNVPNDTTPGYRNYLIVAARGYIVKEASTSVRAY